MFAYLTDSPSRVYETIKNGVAKFNRTTLRGEYKGGGDFAIFTDADRIKGHAISGYDIIGRIDPEMIYVARTMVR